MSNPFTSVNGKSIRSHAKSGKANFYSREKRPPNPRLLSQDIMNSLKGIHNMLFEPHVDKFYPWAIIPKIMSANLTSIKPKRLVYIFTTLKGYIDKMNAEIVFTADSHEHIELWKNFCKFVDDAIQSAKNDIDNELALNAMYDDTEQEIENKVKKFKDEEERKLKEFEDHLNLMQMEQEKEYKALKDIDEMIFTSDNDDELDYEKLDNQKYEYIAAYGITYNNEPDMIIKTGSGEPIKVYNPIITTPKPKINIVTSKKNH